MLASTRPVFSVEFFPPKTEEGRQTLFETVEVLRKLDPHFFSVTYGAGGATREGTLDTTQGDPRPVRIGGDGAPELRR